MEEQAMLEVVKTGDSCGCAVWCTKSISVVDETIPHYRHLPLVPPPDNYLASTVFADLFLFLVVLVFLLLMCSQTLRLMCPSSMLVMESSRHDRSLAPGTDTGDERFNTFFDPSFILGFELPCNYREIPGNSPDSRVFAPVRSLPR